MHLQQRNTTSTQTTPFEFQAGENDAPTNSFTIADKLIHKKKVLILNAYHEGFHWTDRIMRGIYNVFNEVENVELFIEYLDTKRCTDSIYYSQLKEIYQHKYRDTAFDAILSSDDNALNFLLDYRDTLFQDTPVVFCGINDFNESRIEGHPNFTGVYETYDVAGTLDLMLSIHPNINHVAFVFDNTQSGLAFYNRVERNKPKFSDRINFDYLVNQTVPELANRLENLPPNSAVLWGIYIRTGEGLILTSKESIELVSSHTNSPIYCIWDVVGHGVIGGKITSPIYQGEKAAKIVVRLLSGAKSEKIDITGSPMVNKFDHKMLEKYNLNENDLPKGSIIINKPTTFYHQYRELIGYVASVFVLLVVLLIILTFLIRKSKKSEYEIKIKNEKLKEVSSSLRRTNIKLERAKEKAEESDKLKSAFLANMSHEIRTPMNGILGFTEILKQDGLSGEQQQNYIDIIRQSGNRMLDTVNDIINISKIHAGQVQLHYSTINVTDELQSLYSFFKPEADAKGLKLTLTIKFATSAPPLLTDQTKFNSILTNLIKNAIKYSDFGTIELICSKQDEWLICKVKDTGIGIPANRIGVIFDRFIQADIDDVHAVQGSGLGLAITKSYVEMMGGEITVESEEGKGSRFSFKLPWKTDSQPQKSTNNSTTIRQNEEKEELLHILIAEDDEFSYEHLKILLSNSSYEILQAKTGLEAVEIVRSHPTIDLVLMDIKMPVMNGYDATRKIREFNHEVVIIAQTAYALTGDSEKALEAGCNGYISKPIDRDRLMQLIHSTTKK